MAKSKGTGPELALRGLLEAMGLEGTWRWNDPTIPGSPDAFHPGRKIAVFVDGCYWHGHSCRPASRHSPNVKAIKEKDRLVDDELKHQGIQVVRVWECELREHSGHVLSKLMTVL